MSCVDEAVCGRFGPPTFAQHLGQVIEQIDRVQKRVRDMQEEETLQLIRECEQKHHHCWPALAHGARNCSDSWIATVIESCI